MVDGSKNQLKTRSLIGFIRLFAAEIIPMDLFEELKKFKVRAAEIICTHTD